MHFIERACLKMNMRTWTSERGSIEGGNIGNDRKKDTIGAWPNHFPILVPVDKQADEPTSLPHNHDTPHRGIDARRFLGNSATENFPAGLEGVLHAALLSPKKKCSNVSRQQTITTIKSQARARTQTQNTQIHARPTCSITTCN